MKKEILIALCIVCFMPMIFTAQASKRIPNVSQGRLITKILLMQYPFPIPIQITEIKIDNNVIKPGELLNADPDFLRGLRVTVKNLMPVELQGVGVSVRFPYDSDNRPIIPELELIAGNHFQFQDNSIVDFHLAPGESIELTVSDAYYAAFLEDLKNNPTLKLHTLTIVPMMAGIDKNNVWCDGNFIIRDAQNSKHWLKREDAPPKKISEIEYRPKMTKAAHYLTSCYSYSSSETLNCTGTACEVEGGCYQIEHMLRTTETGYGRLQTLRRCYKYMSDPPDPPELCPVGCNKFTTKIDYNVTCP